jgi:hypothetical protein
MELIEKLQALAKKIQQQGKSIQTEEGTKNAFVMPFISQILGYDVFDPNEVIPEFVADVGIKKGEKVDYAIKNGESINILIECKKYGDDLTSTHASQLYRYFSATSARIAILTNGQNYRFFTDLDAPNVMDEKPFLELDLLNIDEYNIPEIAKLAKGDFDLDSIVNSAEELKYTSLIKILISGQFVSPDDDFINYISSHVYEGRVTQKIRCQFSSLIKKATSQFLNDQINDRLKSAISHNNDGEQEGLKELLPQYQPQVPEPNENGSENEHRLITPDEFDAYNVIRAIAWQVLDVSNLAQRNAQSYSAIFAYDNNRKPICRLYFTRQQKQIGIFDSSKKEARESISSIRDIFNYSDKIKETCGHYHSQDQKEKP